MSEQYVALISLAIVQIALLVKELIKIIPVLMTRIKGKKQVQSLDKSKDDRFTHFDFTIDQKSDVEPRTIILKLTHYSQIAYITNKLRFLDVVLITTTILYMNEEDEVVIFYIVYNGNAIIPGQPECLLLS